MSSLKPSGNTWKYGETGGNNRKKRALAANSEKMRNHMPYLTEFYMGLKKSLYTGDLFQDPCDKPTDRNADWNPQQGTNRLRQAGTDCVIGPE